MITHKRAPWICLITLQALSCWWLVWTFLIGNPEWLRMGLDWNSLFSSNYPFLWRFELVVASVLVSTCLLKREQLRWSFAVAVLPLIPEFLMAILPIVGGNA